MGEKSSTSNSVTIDLLLLIFPIGEWFLFELCYLLNKLQFRFVLNLELGLFIVPLIKDEGSDWGDYTE
jgi:hypothetical protein